MSGKSTALAPAFPNFFRNETSSEIGVFRTSLLCSVPILMLMVLLLSPLSHCPCLSPSLSLFDSGDDRCAQDLGEESKATGRELIHIPVRTLWCGVGATKECIVMRCERDGVPRPSDWKPVVLAPLLNAPHGRLLKMQRKSECAACPRWGKGRAASSKPGTPSPEVPRGSVGG